jgi:hypothetical protein
MRRKSVIFIILIACCFIVPGKDLFSRSEKFVKNPDDGIKVEIIGDERGVLDLYQPSGNRDYQCLEARHGERYKIRVSNNSSQMVGLVISVDGRNIISGQKSYNSNNESMYVIKPFQMSSFKGWRSSMQQVQRFYFTDKNDSYAGRLGDYSQTGWIKIAVFKARCVSPPLIVYKSDEMAKCMRSREAGTGYGEGETSYATHIDFEPENWSSRLIKIKYEWPRRNIHDSVFADPPNK